MSDHPPTTVDQLILEHLESAGLPKDAYELVLATVLGGSEPRAELSSATGPPASAYLTHIQVRGFRGVGEPATLDLVPGPGLTIVTGRNGSGKSSFAEAAELALTGDLRRWADRERQWRDGWRNLHVSGERQIQVGLGLDGHRGGATVEVHWPDGADLDDRTSFLQRAGQRRREVAELGWQRHLQLYRPFLSYAELGGLLHGKPSEMYDSLHGVLGLGRLAGIENQLKAARRDSDLARKRAQAELPALREALAAHPDPRAREAERLLDAPTTDLDALERLTFDPGAGQPAEAVRTLAALTLPDRAEVAAQVERVRAAQERIAELARTPAAEARSLASLLRQALTYQQHRPGQPCPVCGGRALDAEWAAGAGEQARRLTAQAEQLDQAHLLLRQARDRLRELVPFAPVLLAGGAEVGVDLSGLAAAWQRWDELVRSDDPGRTGTEALTRFDALVAALEPARAAARGALADRQQAWQPVAQQLSGWVEVARNSRVAAPAYTAARKAVDWLRSVGEEIRNRQLAPLATEASEIWASMRQDSNVELGTVRLAGTGTRRKVDLNVAVDGEPGVALGVMSQGELHALALSLFLPRAMLAASPFRFLVIDDPVQSMDPAKVHGLARVLERVAARRQVIVFTHDDRLPTAVRHLGISAHLRVVSRRERSKVTVAVDEDGDPARRYLADAGAVAKDPAVEAGLRTKVTCALVREAIEARCHDLVLTEGVRGGRPITELEAALERATKLRQTLALALLGDPARDTELNGRLDRLHPRAVRVVRDANRGAHGSPVDGPLTALVNDAKELVTRMVAR